MGRVAAGVLLVGASACSFSGTGAPDAPRGDGPGGGRDAADAPMLGPWGEPQPIAELNTNSNEDDPSLTGDGLEIYFGSDRQGAPEDVWRATRDSPSAPWRTPERVAELSSPQTDSNIKVSGDGLTIFVTSTRGSVDTDLYVAKRPDRSAPWGTPVRIAELCSAQGDWCACARPDLLRITFCSNRDGDEDLYLAERATVEDPWGAPVQIAELASAVDECDPIEPDERTMYFGSNRMGGDYDIYVAERVTATTYGAPAAVAPVNTAFRDRDPWVSADGRVMVFASNRAGTDDLYISTR